MVVEVLNKSSRQKLARIKFKKKAERILEFLKQNRAELSLAFVDNREIQKLNARYRNKNQPTDVLSFPPEKSLATEVDLLGDVVISVEQAEIQAKRRRRPLDEEMESLLIHGILHLLGYDHERSTEDARVMRRLERKIHRALCDKKKLGV
jgi:probable rRNA maturation factor